MFGVAEPVMSCGTWQDSARFINLKAVLVDFQKNACGFRNRERFRTAILFHCGGLDIKARFLADASYTDQTKYCEDYKMLFRREHFVQSEYENLGNGGCP